MSKIKLTDVKVGDVVINNGIKMVVLSIKSNEDMSSCSYDRQYKLCDLDELDFVTLLSQEEFNKLGYWVQLKGTEVPIVEKCDDIAPFNIKSEVIYNISRRKKESY